MNVQYEVTAAIESVGKAQSGNGWRLTLDWKMPDSSYNQTVNGQDWDQIKGYGVGDVVDVVLTRGSIKADKSGTKSYDYFWNLDGIGPTEGGPLGVARAISDGGVSSVTQMPHQNGGKPDIHQDEYRRSKETMNWIEAINSGVHLHGPVAGDYAGANLRFIKNVAIRIYGMITEGPPIDQDGGEWTDPRGDRAPEFAADGSQLADIARETVALMTRPEPLGGVGKLKELDEARWDANGEEYCTAPELVAFIELRYGTDPRGLTAEQIDSVINNIRAGEVHTGEADIPF